MSKDDNPEGQKLGNKFLIGKFVAGGSFGKLHLGKNTQTGESVAIKLESKKCPQAQLPLEYGFYKILGNTQKSAEKGIPKIHYFGLVGGWNALVMDMLGPTLEKVHQNCGSKFSLKTTAQLAIQLLNVFEYFHGRRLIYRDIKPENFLFGVSGSDRYNIVHLIDLGLCKEYKEENGTHIPYVEGKGTIGTVRYMSYNNHMGRELSRRDDLEALSYMFVYFMKGELPWQGVDAQTPKERMKKVGQIKKQTKTQVLCADLPEQFATYLNAVKALEFTEDPKYGKYIELFTKILTKSNLQNDGSYDFDQNHKPKGKSKIK